MHSPKTVAFEIYLGRKKKKNGNYRNTFITIWHNDPCTDGTDDSCGWFMRKRHGDNYMLKKIEKDLDFDFDRTFKSEITTYYTGLFCPDGTPNFSVQGIVLNMFFKAIHAYYDYNWKKSNKWMQANLFEIMMFAENTTDSLRDDVIGLFRIPCGEKFERNEQIKSYASIIYSWILRKNRKWYQHPKWHINHWEIQFHPYQNFKRRFWDKCCICGKRGFKTTCYSDWNGTKIWHEECNK